MPTPLGYRLRRLKRSLLAKTALLTSRASSLLGNTSTLAKMEYLGHEPGRRLVIFLPGIDDLAEDFERRGFIDDMRRHGIMADAIAIDAHYGYYATRTIHDRITDDVVSSARSAGYEEIWLAGISLGGFGAASYAARHASDISGLLLFAPYLGGAPLIREIVAAGGIDRWEPGEVGTDDYQRALWSWFKQHLSRDDPALPIYLAYGNRDMFRRANGLLGQVLPQERVLSIPGGHDWHTWKALWQMVLPNWKSSLG
ncbi:MAG TPA: alpha/beta hydrolase [Noviherbaspirillum sp.]|uniref:alpha/beta hydrolase n=1 Tax=Noviherbaspirillum sp. TaxID=1926288 RepID=UPI002B47636A|nr:alpha/beta hydrolase [Noviherbaspirillum sp.]HJV88575.1 alpha/beta hydrolase [Noviherbaspirillum sp.]